MLNISSTHSLSLSLSLSHCGILVSHKTMYAYAFPTSNHTNLHDNYLIPKLSTHPSLPLPHNSPLNFHYAPEHALITHSYNANQVPSLQSQQPAQSISELDVLVNMRVDEFYLPPLQPLLPLKSHPLHHVISSRVNDWHLSWRRPHTPHHKKLMLQANSAGLLTWTVPNATNPEALERAAKLITWILNFDDIIDESHLNEADDESYAQFARRVFETPDNIRDEEVANFPEKKAILELEKEFRENLSPRLHKKHVNGVLVFLGAAQREAAERKREVPPDVASYIVNRRKSLMFYHVPIFVQDCMGMEMSDEMMEVEGMKELFEALTDHAAWTNDAISFRKEYYNRDFENLPSLVYLEQQQHSQTPGSTGGGFQSAMERVCEMIRERERDFILHLHRILMSEAAAAMPELLVYLENLPYVLSGHFEWLCTSRRYHGVDNEDMGKKRHGMLRMDPHKTIIL